MNWKFAISKGKLLCIEKVLQYRAGNYIQYPMISHMEKNIEKKNVHTYTNALQ